MTEQQRAEYMAIVAACAGLWEVTPEEVARCSMLIWVAANKFAEKAATQ